MKRGTTPAGLRILRTAAIKQKLASLEVAQLCCNMKGGLVCFSESDILLTTTTEQELAKFDVSFSCGDVKSGHTLCALGILIETTIKQKLANLELASTGSNVDRAGLLPIYVSIEVQSTDAHIPRLQRETEPCCVDGATLLAQRVGSTCCQRRR